MSDQKPAWLCWASSGLAVRLRPALAPAEMLALVVRQVSLTTMGNPLCVLLHLSVLLLGILRTMTNSLDIRRHSMQNSEHVKLKKRDTGEPADG